MRSLFKMIKALGLTLGIIMMVSACATAIPQIPKKYALDNQLEKVNSIQSFRLTDKATFTTFEQSFEDPTSVINRRDTVLLNKTSRHWIEVDQQSLIVQTSPREYYLLVLQIPAPELKFSEYISIYGMGNVIKSGSDYIQFPDYNVNLRYPIVRIYRINGPEQASAIRDQLRVE
jgi:hypothetical protein